MDARELADLTHVDRMRRLVELGRRAASGVDDAQQTIAGWARHESRYLRTLAVATAHGSRDATLILAALADSTRIVARRAERVAALVLTDDEVVGALGRARSPIAACRLCAAFVRRGRRAAVSRWLEGQLAQPKPNPLIVDRLGYGSEQLVEKHLQAWVDALSPDGLARLARYHAALLARDFARRIEAGLDVRRRWRLLGVVGQLTKHAPAEALPLVDKLLSTGSEPKHWLSAPLQELVRRLPRETFDMLRRLRESVRPMPPPGPFGAVRFSSVAHRLDEERLSYLVRHASATLTDGPRARRWFLRLSPAQKSAVVDTFLSHGCGPWGAFLFRHIATDGKQGLLRRRAHARWSAAAQDKRGVIALSQLAMLPRDLKALEAERYLNDVAALATRPTERIAYAALLPFERAMEALASYLSHPEGEVRALAMRAVASVPATYPEDLPQVLEVLKSRQFEQDPVRLAMLGGLVALPQRTFSKECFSALGEVLRHALDAADLSPASALQIEMLCVRLFRVDANWSAGWLASLLEVRGAPPAWGLIDGLTPNEVRALTPAVRELCQRWTDRERVTALLWLARSFGMRLPLAPPLIDSLERVAMELPAAAAAAASLGLLRSHVPERFAEVMPRLLKDDPSAVTLPVVARAVATHRQDLLAPFLRAEPMQGRFASGRTQWVIDFGAGYGTWTEAQQCAQAENLAGLLREKGRDVPAQRSAVSTLAQLAFAPDALVIEFASDPRPPVRELAVRALGRVDHDAAALALIDCLGDDRARWAIYALRAKLREKSEDDVLALLERAPLTKVTVAKEVLRLTGELAGSAGYAYLIGLDRSTLHRDVKIALMRALWDHIEQPETWRVFEEAVQDPDWVVAGRLADIPVARLTAETDTRLAALLVRVLQRPEPEARLELLARVAYLPLADRERALFSACVEHLGAPHPDEAAAALGAVLARMVPTEKQTVITRLVTLIPQRRVFQSLYEALAARLGPYAPNHVLALGKAVLARMGDDPVLIPQVIHLASLLYTVSELSLLLQELARADRLHFDAMTAAVAAVGRVASPSAIEVKLRDAPDPRLRRLALEALVLAARPKRGWTEERREQLAHYRADPDPLVAGHAAFVFPPAKSRRKRELLDKKP